MSTAELEVVKLKNAGESVTLTVERCAPATRGNFPGIEFEGDGLLVEVPKSSADRQLERLGLTYEQCVGKTLRIWRGENKTDATKPYWNVDVLSGAKGVASAGSTPTAATRGGETSKPSPAPSTPAAGFDDPLYSRITEHVLNNLAPLYRLAGIPIDASAAAAIAATLYIQAKRG